MQERGEKNCCSSQFSIISSGDKTANVGLGMCDFVSISTD